jgi:diguanylate cyclase (GGDEF)-like protein
VDRTIRYNHQLSLLLLDIDNFKQFNDTFGHLEGDQILVKLGRTILTCLRKMDSAYRYGGEEFTIILPETAGEEAITVAQRIRAKISAEVFIQPDDQKRGITASIGVTEYLPNESLSDFIKRSDKAMYTSKDQGRNKVTSLF